MNSNSLNTSSIIKHRNNIYRIAGKFGGGKVWRIGHLEVLARKSLANVDDLEDEEVDLICHGNLAGFNWRMTCNFAKFANFAKLFPHQTFPLYGIRI